MDKKHKRILIITGEITEDSVSDAILKIAEWNNDDAIQEENILNFEREPIEIHVNSFGGSLHISLGFSEFLAQSITPIRTICSTVAMSGGFIIFLGGHERIVYKEAGLMYHQLSSGIWDNIEAIRINHKQLEGSQERYEKYITSRCKLTRKDLKSKDAKQEDWHFTLDEIQKYELAHIIIGMKNKK